MIMNEKERSVSLHGRTYRLTPIEYGILHFLCSHPDTIYNADEIYRNVWKMEPFATEGIIAVHIRHLREKLEEDPSRPRYIRSHWGRGYCYTGN